MANIDKITLRGVNYSIIDSSVPSYVKGITQTDITNWNNKLDSFTETDPSISSYLRAITEQDISNWNSKTDNVGTITGITMNGASKGTSGIVDLGTVLTEHQSLASYATSANYDSSAKKIYLKHNNNVLSEIDATDFIKDGMVDTAYVNGSYLTISFNTDAGKEPVNIEISDIFDPTNYYDKPTVDEKVESLMQNQKLSFYTTGTCSVNVYVKDDSLNGDYSQQTPTDTFEYSANTLVSLNIANNEHFEISNPNDCINIIYSWPGVCEKFYDWFMSVDMFCNMIFNFNKMDHTQWDHTSSNPTSYKYGVKEAQYRNCIFWWDVAMTDVNVHCYTLHKTQECPLFYSTIPENTYKALCEPYNITNNPNFTNEVFLNSMALSSCRSALSYSHTRSVPFGCWQDADVVTNVIKINGDCRTFLAWSGAEDTATFDCETVTNFGYGGSGRYEYWNAFYECYNLKNLMLKNLKVSVDLSWSPISQYSLDYIVSNAANESTITIKLSQYTWYNLTDSIKTAATNKNITLLLGSLSNNSDLKIWQDVEGIKNSYLSADNLDLTSYVSKTELNAAGYLTSFTETDPTVPSYVKGITENDITNWNSKTDNVGTITGITMNGTNKGTSGVVDLGNVLTEHQDLSSYVPYVDINNGSYKLKGIGDNDLNFVEIHTQSGINTNYNGSIIFGGILFDGTHIYDYGTGETEYKFVKNKRGDVAITKDITDAINSYVISASYLTSESDPTVPSHVKSITEQNITNWNTAHTNSHTHSNKTVIDGITSTDISNWNSKTDNVGTITGITMNGASKGTGGIVDLGTVLTEHQSLSSYATSANYDSSTKKIYLKNGTTTLSEIDATDFIKDGMVDTAYVQGANLIISFNTDAGKEAVNVPISDIFNANNYYTKTEINNAGYLTSESDPTVPTHVKSITEQNITNWNAAHTNSHTHSNKTVLDGIKSTDIDNWNSKTDNVGTITGITMNGASKGTSGVVDLGTVVTSETDPVFTASAAHGITSSDISNWNSKTDNVGTITGITMNGTSKGTSGVVDLGTVITSHQSLANYVTKSELNSASYLQSFTESDPTVPSHVKSITEQDITDWNNKLSSETQLSKGTTTGSGNAVTDISVSNHQITLTKGKTFLESFTETDPIYSASAAAGITSSDITNWNNKLNSFTETDPTVPTHVKSITQQNITDWNNKLSSETQLSKGTTTGSGNAVTDISVSNHQITLTKGSTFLTEHQNIKTINNNTLVGTGNVTINELPTVTSSDNGKVLQVVNGVWTLVSPVTMYTGTGTPDNSQGNNGDLYMQI